MLVGVPGARWADRIPDQERLPGYRSWSSGRSATPASCLVCKLAATTPHKRAKAWTAENPVSPAPASTLEDRSMRPLNSPGEWRSSAARLSERARIGYACHEGVHPGHPGAE